MEGERKRRNDYGRLDSRRPWFPSLFAVLSLVQKKLPLVKKTSFASSFGTKENLSAFSTTD